MNGNSFKKPVKCSICDTNFAQMDNMNKHVAFHEGEKPFKCNCANFVQKNFLKTHVSSVHEAKKIF